MITNRWTPTRVAPSGTYGFLLKEPEGGKPFIHVVQRSDRGFQPAGEWFPTPASWRVEDLADAARRSNLALIAPLAIDAGQSWALSREDTLAVVLYAREVEAEADPKVARTELPEGPCIR